MAKKKSTVEKVKDAVVDTATRIGKAADKKVVKPAKKALGLTKAPAKKTPAKKPAAKKTTAKKK